jgi:glycosyltransferase involved in cell wall biosynthesis
MNISIDMINQIRANLKHFEVVHVHSWEQFPEILASYYAKKFSVPYVLQVHGSLHNYDSRNRLKQSYKMIFGDRVLQGASRLIAFNETEAEEYLAMHAPKDRIRIIPNGVDFSNYENLPPQGNFKRFYNIGKDKKIILYLGRVNARKGIDFLVQGYYHFVKTTKRSDTLLVIAGPDDGYLSHIKSLVQTLGLSDLVLFTGLLSSDLKVYAYVDSTICVCLSPFEPFGVVTLEAAVCGKPVIVSKESPIASVVEEAKFGIAVEFNRIDKLAEILDSHLKNTEALEIMGQRGRKFVFDNYRSSEIVHKLENVYEELG